MTKVGAIIAREMEESEARGRKVGRAEGRVEGRAEGRAAALVTILASKGEVPEKLEQKIYAQQKSELLDRWLRIAVNTPDVATFEAQIQ